MSHESPSWSRPCAEVLLSAQYSLVVSLSSADRHEDVQLHSSCDAWITSAVAPGLCRSLRYISARAARRAVLRLAPLARHALRVLREARHVQAALQWQLLAQGSPSA